MKKLPDNNTILKALAKDDAEIFGQLYDHYSRSLFKNIYKILPDQPEAEDILQAVFLKLWEQRQLLNNKQSVAGWLFTTSFYLTMTAVRKKVKNRIEELTEYSEGIYQDDMNEERFEQRTSFLKEAINLLPERKRLAFELYKIEGKSYKEVGEILGIKEETVKEYIKSAIQILKQLAAKSDMAFYTIFIYFLA